MKWKSLYKISKNFLYYVAMPFVVANIYVALRLEFDKHPDGSFVAINYVPYSGGNTLGYYDISTNQVTINYLPDEVVYPTIVHELKHADNAHKFSYFLNVDADELSARLATGIYTLGFHQTLDNIHVMVDSVSKLADAFHTAMDNLLHERLSNNVAWQNAKSMDEMDSIYTATTVQLRAERQNMIDSIVQRFDGAVRDSMVHAVETKYSEKPASIQKLEKLKEKLDSISYEGSRIDKNILEHDFNYHIQDLNQHLIDSIISDAMHDYQTVRSKYFVQRQARMLHTQLHPINDAELEKLFTYKINGVHRSLFREASPEIQQMVRQMANSDNLIVRAKQVLGRE